MVDMNATIVVDGLTHPIDTNIDVSEIQNKNNENCDTAISMAEPEEGQIIDEDVEFETISSDEDPIVFTEADEASMRKRIEELELRNAELEKIAVISVINNYDLGNNKIVPSQENKDVDIIELSDYDEYTEYASNEIKASAFIPYESKYAFKNYYNNCSNTASCFPTSSKNSYKSRKRHRRTHSTEEKNYDENKSSKISRTKKRRKKSRSPLLEFSSNRQKLSSTRRHQSHSKRSKRKRRLKNQYDTSSNDSDSEKAESYEISREELRKAIKRNSETIRKGNLQNIVGKKTDKTIEQNIDVIEIENDNEVEKINSETQNDGQSNNLVGSEESDSLEEHTLRMIALKSAIVKKHLDRKRRKEIDEKKPYSPSDFNYWCGGVSIENSPKDFDDLEIIESNNISPSDSPINLSNEEDNAKSNDVDLTKPDFDMDIPTLIGLSKNWHSNLPSIDILKQFAPPPPQITMISPTLINFDNKFSKDTNEEDNSNSKLIISQKNSSPDDLSDEEELALRALLLSTLNSPKGNNLIIRKTVLTDNSQNRVLTKIEEPRKNSKFEKIQNNESKEEIADENDSIENSVLKTKNTNKTESLLKEAVKRLKTTTLNNLSENDLSFDVNSYLSENEIDKSSKHFVPDSNHSFKETQNSTEQETESISESRIDSYKTKKLLIKSRQKLNKFIQCFNKEKNSNFESDIILNCDEINEIEDSNHATKVDIEKFEEFEEKHQSESCIEALQKIIELNYEKLVKIDNEMKDDDMIIANSGSDNEDDQNVVTFQKTINLEINSENSLENPEEHNLLGASETENVETYKKDEINFNKPDDQKIAPQVEPQIIEIDNLNLNICVNNSIPDKSDNSLEITRKIESLQKLSESIAQTTKITAKAKASLDVNKSQSGNSNSAITNTIVQNRKIVKINKIINQTALSTLKRNHTSNQNSIPNKLVKLSATSIATTTSRISPTTITDASTNATSRISKINRTTGKIIISVGTMSSSDDDDNILNDLDEQSNKNEEPQYNDNASPMSFQMDSPCYSPKIRTFDVKSPCVEEFQNNIEIDKNAEKNLEEESNIRENITEKNVCLTKNVINDVFQAKLEKFLKSARSKVEIEKSKEQKVESNTLEVKTPTSKSVPSLNSSAATPVAVRHLPESSQLEYRMLVHRMKILEKQKTMKIQQVEQKPDFCPKFIVQNVSKGIDSTTGSLLETLEKNESDDFLNKDEVNRDQDVQDVQNLKLIPAKNITNLDECKTLHNADKLEIETNIENEKIIQQNILNDLKKELKTKQNFEAFKKYENAYEKNSNSILENLNRALKFVAMGKEVKTKKVLIEAKLEQLKAELKACEADLKLQNQKIGKIYPAISKSYNTIVGLKSRRIKLQKITKHLGKSINGNSYKLKEVCNTEIQSKFKHLSSEISYVKNLKISDLEKSIETLQKKSETAINANEIVGTSSSLKAPAEEIVRISTELIKPHKDNTNNKGEQNIEKISKDSHVLENIIHCECTEPNEKENSLQSHIQSANEASQNFQCSEIKNNEGTVIDNKNIELDQKEPIFEESFINVITMEDRSTNCAGNCTYISPLDFLTERPFSNDSRLINPNEIVCPFQLMGQCDDKDCKYNHLNLEYSSKLNQ